MFRTACNHRLSAQPPSHPVRLGMTWLASPAFLSILVAGWPSAHAIRAYARTKQGAMVHAIQRRSKNPSHTKHLHRPTLVKTFFIPYPVSTFCVSANIDLYRDVCAARYILPLAIHVDRIASSDDLLTGCTSKTR